MYLWKCWRNAWLSVAIYGAALGLAIWSLLKHSFVYLSYVRNGTTVVSNGWAALHHLEVMGLLLAFIAWMMGSSGIPRDIGEGSGAFLLSRPRQRRFFLWCDSGFAFGTFLTLAAVTMALFEFGIRLHWIRFGGPELWNSARGTPPGMDIPAVAAILIPLCAVVYAGLVYCVTYLCTLLVARHSIGQVLSVGVFFGYGWLRAKARDLDAPFNHLLPSWWVDPFPDPVHGSPAPHIWVSLLLRVVAVVVLLLAAQLVLERREIRA